VAIDREGKTSRKSREKGEGGGVRIEQRKGGICLREGLSSIFFKRKGKEDRRGEPPHSSSSGGYERRNTGLGDSHRIDLGATGASRKSKVPEMGEGQTRRQCHEIQLTRDFRGEQAKWTDEEGPPRGGVKNVVPEHQFVGRILEC